MNMTTVWPTPPTIVEVLRPHLSAHIMPGTVMRKIRRADMPDARKEAVLDVMPADWNRRGAY